METQLAKLNGIFDGSQLQNQPTAKSRTSKAPAPHPPVMRYNPDESEIQQSDVPTSYSASNRRALLKQSKQNLQEPQVLQWKKIEDGAEPKRSDATSPGGSNMLAGGDEKPTFAGASERELETFYAMFYTKEGTDMEWKLLVDGFIPVCFIQFLGDANRPFKIIAVLNSKRVMDFRVTVHSKSARSKSFVKWQDGSSVYGARFGKEQQAEQFHQTILRMVSTMRKTEEILNQPERKTIVGMMSDPKSSVLIHTKVSIMVKLPNKESTVISVPGLLTMGELFELICKKEKLKTAEHQLSVPKIGGQKVTFDSHTAVGSLKVREVSIIETGLSKTSASRGSVDLGGNVEEIHNLETMSDENKTLDIHLPKGYKKSFKVPVDMNMRKLVMYLCKKEQLNPRFHSLQYIDFKHEFLNMDSSVNELEVRELRLMDKRGAHLYRKSRSIPSLIDQDIYVTTNHSNAKPGHDSGLRKSSVMIEAVDDEKSSLPRSLSCEVLSDDAEDPSGRERKTSTEGLKMEVHNGKPPWQPQQPSKPKPYASRASSAENLSNKRGSSGSDLSIVSELSPGANAATVSPDSTKLKRKAPAPPPRPSFPTPRSSRRSDSEITQHNHSLSAVSTPSTSPSPGHKKRKAPPRPTSLPVKSCVPPPANDVPGVKVVVKNGQVNAVKDEETDDISPVDKSAPPVFIAPPPPDDLPPPLDECATPVCPVDEDDFERRSLTGDILNSFSGSFNERRLSQESRGSPEGSPSLVHHPTPQIEQKSTRSTKSKPIPLPRTSSLDLEQLKPPLEFSTQNGSTSESEAPESMAPEDYVVPQPPLPSVEELVAMMTPRKEKPDDVAAVAEELPTKQSEECPIPPPEDFANINPPPGFECERTVEEEKPAKKLTVDKSLFPWIDEPAPFITPVLPENAARTVIERDDSSLEGDEDMEDITISPGPFSPGPEEKMEPSTDFLRFLERKKQESLEYDTPNASGDEIPFETNPAEESDLSVMKSGAVVPKKDIPSAADDDSIDDLKLFALEANRNVTVKTESREVVDESLDDLKSFAADLRTSKSNKGIELAVEAETIENRTVEVKKISLSENNSFVRDEHAEGLNTNVICVNEMTEKSLVPQVKNVHDRQVVVEEINSVSETKKVESSSYDPFLLLEKSIEDTSSAIQIPVTEELLLQSKQERGFTEEQIVPTAKKEQQSSSQDGTTEQQHRAISPTDMLISSSSSKSPSPPPSPILPPPEDRILTPDILRESTISPPPSHPFEYKYKVDSTKLDDTSSADIRRDSSPVSPDQQVPGSSSARQFSLMTTTEQIVVGTTPKGPSPISFSDPVDMPKPPPFTVPPLRRYSDLAAQISFVSSAAKTEKTSEEQGEIQHSQQHYVAGADLSIKDQSVPSPSLQHEKELDMNTKSQPELAKTPETQATASPDNTQPKELPKMRVKKSQSVEHADLQVCSAVKKYLRGTSVGHSTRPRSWVAPSARDTSNAPKRSSLIWAPEFKPSGNSNKYATEATKHNVLALTKSEPAKLQQEKTKPQFASKEALSQIVNTAEKEPEKKELTKPELDNETQYPVHLKSDKDNSISSTKPLLNGVMKRQEIPEEVPFSNTDPMLKKTVSIEQKHSVSESEPKFCKIPPENGDMNEINPAPGEQRASMRYGGIVGLLEKNHEKEKQDNNSNMWGETIASKPRQSSWFAKQGSLGGNDTTAKSVPLPLERNNVRANSFNKNDEVTKEVEKPPSEEKKDIEVVSAKNNTVSKQDSKDSDDQLETQSQPSSYGRKKYEIIFASSNSSQKQTDKKPQSSGSDSTTLSANDTRPRSTSKESLSSSSGRKKYEILFANAKSSEESKDEKVVSGAPVGETKPSYSAGSVSKLRSQFSAPAPKAPEVKTKPRRTSSETVEKEGNDKKAFGRIGHVKAPNMKNPVPVQDTAKKQASTNIILEEKNALPKVVLEEKQVPPNVVVEERKAPPRFVIEMKNDKSDKTTGQGKTCSVPQAQGTAPSTHVEIQQKKAAPGKMTIVSMESETDTKVVPTGVVARMKALKESRNSSTGS